MIRDRLTKPQFSLTLIAFVLAFALVWALGVGAPSNGGVVAESVSWATQLSIAQNEARRQDKNALLYHVTAFPVEGRSHSWDYSKPLLVEFEFVGTFATSGADLITVSFHDSSPTATLNLKNEVNKVKSPAVWRDISGSIESVRLNAREAGALTWHEASLQAMQRGVRISPVLTMNMDSNPAKWRVQYVASGSSIFSLGREMAFTVNAKTSRILERDLSKWYVDFSKP